MYISAALQNPANKRTVRKYNPEAVETLQGCLEMTEWDAFCDPHGEDILIIEMTEDGTT